MRISMLLLTLPAATLVLDACARPARQQMNIEPGPEGTIVVVGSGSAAIAIPNVVGDDGVTKFTFKISARSTNGISLGTAVGGDEASLNNEQKLFTPASITKVITAGLALKALGPDFRFTTEAVWDEAGAGFAKNLTIFADGDPEISSTPSSDGLLKARLNDILIALKAKGIQRVEGPVRLVSMDPRKDAAAPPDGMDAEDNLACYGARSQSFNFRRNCSSLTVTDRDKASWADPGINMPITFNVDSGSRRAIGAVPSLNSIHELVGYLVRGTWAPGSRPVYFGLPVADVKAWFGNALLATLARGGLDVKDAVPTNVTLAEANVLIQERSSHAGNYKMYSEKLSSLVREMCKPSDNFLADTLFKAIAVLDQHLDLREAGHSYIQRNVTELLTRAGHADYANEIDLVDGAGLSRHNHVTPRAFIAVMRELTKEPTFPYLFDALPIAGVDGTLKNRMKGTAAQGVVHAKTGTLSGAYQLAGYVPVKSAAGTEYVPFAILSSTAGRGGVWPVHAFQDRVVAELAAKLRSGR